MDTELATKVASLPKWAREYIKQLEIRANPEDHVRNLANLRQQLQETRKQLEHTKQLNDALKELLTCAARGGHADAKAYVQYIFEQYGPDKDTEDTGDDS